MEKLLAINEMNWNAIMLAGDRGSNDPVNVSANVSGKAAAKLRGRMLIEHVSSALYESNVVKQIYAVGPDEYCLNQHGEINAILERFKITHIPPEAGPSSSALKGVFTANAYPILVVTCDLPLLTSTMVDEFCRSMENVQADFVVGAISYDEIKSKLPTLLKTKYKFAGHSVCFANMFAVLNESGLRAIEYWQDLESDRKKPLKLIRKIDWRGVIKYKLGKLSLDQAADGLSQKVNAKIVIKNLSIPELAVDVDSAHDYQVLNQYMQ